MIAAYRVARFLAGQRSSLGTWRRIVVNVSGCLLIVATGLVISLASAADCRQGVAHDRWPVPAARGEGQVRVLEFGPVVKGRQFPIYWIEPLSDDAPLPPGLERYPEPGTVALSPALHNDLGPDVTSTFGLQPAADGVGPMLIDASGLTSPREYIAYARPAEDHDLNTHRTVEIAGFGAESRLTPVGAGYEPDSPLSILVGGLALIVVPASYLLWVAVGSGSQMRDERLSTLFEIGASRRTRHAIIFVEAVLQAVVGVAAGVAAWEFGLSRLGGIPAAGLAFFEGDLQVPWTWTVATAAGTLAATGILAVAQSSLGRNRRTPPRRSLTRRLGLRTMLPIRVLLVLAVVGFVGLARSSAYPRSSQYWQLALVLAICSQPLVLPLYVETLGRWARTRTHPTTWLAGQRMVRSPVNLARPAFALAGLVLVMTVGTAAAAVAWSTQDSNPTSDPAQLVLGWVDPEVGDVDKLRAALPSSAVIAVGSDSAGTSRLWVSDCTDLLPVAQESTCDGAIPASVTERIREATRQTGVGGSIRVDANHQPGSTGPVSAVLILGPAGETGEDLYRQVLPVAHSLLGPSNLSGGRFLQLSENSKRAAGGVAVAGGVFLLGALILLGDRSLMLARENEVLDVLGVQPDDQRRVSFLEVALPGLVSTVAGGGLGLMFVWAGADLDTKPQTVYLWLPILLEVLFVGALTVVVAFWIAHIRPARAFNRGGDLAGDRRSGR